MAEQLSKIVDHANEANQYVQGVQAVATSSLLALDEIIKVVGKEKRKRPHSGKAGRAGGASSESPPSKKRSAPQTAAAATSPTAAAGVGMPMFAIDIAGKESSKPTDLGWWEHVQEKMLLLDAQAIKVIKLSASLPLPLPASITEHCYPVFAVDGAGAAHILQDRDPWPEYRLQNSRTYQGVELRGGVLWREADCEWKRDDEVGRAQEEL